MSSLTEVFTQKTFETTSALSAFYLWIAFSYLTGFLNCDIQRFIREHPITQHIIAILTFFFLFTVLDSKNDVGITVIWVKTLFVYFVFIALIKSKWYFVLPSLGLLIADQTIKMHINYIEKRNEPKEKIDRMRKARRIINIVNIVTITLGFAHYLVKQVRDKKDDFSMYKFFLPPQSCSISHK